MDPALLPRRRLPAPAVNRSAMNSRIGPMGWRTGHRQIRIVEAQFIEPIVAGGDRNGDRARGPAVPDVPGRIADDENFVGKPAAPSICCRGGWLLGSAPFDRRNRSRIRRRESRS